MPVLDLIVKLSKMPHALLLCTRQQKCCLLQIHAHNLQPALQWVEEHRQELQQQPQAAGFEFKLYRLSFLHTLQQHGNTRTSQV